MEGVKSANPSHVIQLPEQVNLSSEHVPQPQQHNHEQQQDQQQQQQQQGGHHGGSGHMVHMELEDKDPNNFQNLSLDMDGGGLRILFKDLEYSVKSNVNKKESVYLLKKVSGWFLPHEMSALMGPSGSGKTTMLDVLAGRKTEGKVEGTILFGGTEPSQQFLRRYTGYVEQFDTLLGILTVEEMLLYTAEMKRSMKEDISSKRMAVDQVIKKLGLETCRDVKIGSEAVKGISGGQAKRVNIGIAIITNPRVLFLDEPTSGLDSYTANQVMKVVRSLLKDGTTICATIHSPSQFTFELFDSLIMLVRGRVVYFGSRADGPAFATSICEQVKERTENYNDAEFLVDLITEADRCGKGDDIATRYAESSRYRDSMATLEGYLASEEKLDGDLAAQIATKSSTMTPWYHGLWTLIKYRTSHNYKDPEFLGPRIGDKIFVSLVIMTLYLGMGDDYEDSNYANISAVLYSWVILPSYGAASYVPTLFLERGLFTRERNDGLYHVITYLLFKMFDELVLLLPFSAAISAYTFYGVRFQGQYVYFWLCYWVMMNLGVILAYLVAAASPSLDAANAILPTYVTTWLFFSGFLIRFDDMRWYWKWYSYIVPLKYSWGGLVVNSFSGDLGDPVWGGNNGQTVLEVYGLDGVDKWAYLGYTSLFFLFFFICTYVIMSVRKYESR